MGSEYKRSIGEMNPHGNFESVDSMLQLVTDDNAHRFIIGGKIFLLLIVDVVNCDIAKLEYRLVFG